MAMAELPTMVRMLNGSITWLAARISLSRGVRGGGPDCFRNSAKRSGAGWQHIFDPENVQAFGGHTGLAGTNTRGSNCPPVLTRFGWGGSTLPGRMVAGG